MPNAQSSRSTRRLILHKQSECTLGPPSICPHMQQCPMPSTLWRGSKHTQYHPLKGPHLNLHNAYRVLLHTRSCLLQNHTNSEGTKTRAVWRGGREEGREGGTDIETTSKHHPTAHQPLRLQNLATDSGGCSTYRQHHLRVERERERFTRNNLHKDCHGPFAPTRGAYGEKGRGWE